jgi:hypothetical protein
MKRVILGTTLLFVFFFGIARGSSMTSLDSGDRSSAQVEAGSDLLSDFSRNALGDVSPTGMGVTSAAVTFDPKKKDKFVLKGTTGGLVLTGATSVIFEAGGFSQEIALTAFTQSKQKYTFKGVAGEAGISSLILDMGKGQFSATLQNVFLPGFTNPLPITLRAGTTSECRMAQFSVKNNKWSFKGSANPQYDCLMTASPRATARGLFVNQPRDITFSVPVVSSPGLNPNSIELFRVDGSFNILGASLCTLADNGNPSNGDQTAGDSIFSCIANVQESAAGRMVFIVRGEVGGRITYSPTFSLDVVTPYTAEQAQETLTAHQQAVAVWQEKLAAYGNNKKAWGETVKAVKLLGGIKDAGVTKDGTMLWIEFTSGIRGGVPLTQETESSNAMERVVRPITQSASKESRRALQATGGCTDVANKDVLVWDTFADRYEENHFLSKIFRQSNKNFVIVESFAEDATVGSLRNITDYGTVILRTRGRSGRNSHVYETGEPVTFQTLGDEQYMFDLLTGCLEIVYFWVRGIGWDYFYGFTPNFISTLDGEFRVNLVYIEATNSVGLAPVFMKKKTHTFFGYAGKALWGRNVVGQELFTVMVNNGKDTGEAYAAVPHQSEGGFFWKIGSRPDKIGYECITTRPASCSTALNGDSHWIYEIPSGTRYEYDAETLYTAGGSYPDYTGQFDNNVFSMTWDFERFGTRFWGSIEATLDAPPGEATRVATFTASRNYEESSGELATLSETFQGSNIPLTERTDYGIYFEIVGADVCSHVVASGLRDAHRSDGLHQYWYSGIGCNSNGRLYIGFDFLD